MTERLQTSPQKIQALMFDFGGVLVDLDLERCCRAFDELGINLRPYVGAYKQSGILSDFESGKIDTIGFFNAIRSTFNAPDLKDEAILAAWQLALLDVSENRLQMLLKAKQHYSLFLLSNTNPIHWAMACDHYFRYKGHNIHDFFDQTFLSFQLGVEKPAPLAFEKVDSQISFAPEEVLFFDDSHTNCAAAHSLGFQTVEAPENGGWLDLFDENGCFIGKQSIGK